MEGWIFGAIAFVLLVVTAFCAGEAVGYRRALRDSEDLQEQRRVIVKPLWSGEKR